MIGGIDRTFKSMNVCPYCRELHWIDFEYDYDACNGLDGPAIDMEEYIHYSRYDLTHFKKFQQQERKQRASLQHAPSQHTHRAVLCVSTR